MSSYCNLVDAKLNLNKHYCSVSELSDYTTDIKSSDVVLTRSASHVPVVRSTDFAEVDVVTPSTLGIDQVDLMDQPSSNPDLCTTSLKPASQVSQLS